MGVAKTAAFKGDWLQGLLVSMPKPARLQIAALCVRRGKNGTEILLVSTRDTGRMILPKGWPERNKPPFKTAAAEAYEEAGVVGKADSRPLGIFKSFKGLNNGRKLKTRVLVFKVQFEKQLKKYPELGQRDCTWLPLDDAIKAVDEKSLKNFLRDHQRRIKSV